MPLAPFSPLHAGPLRRVVSLLVIAAAAHLALAGLAFTAWQARTLPLREPAAVLAPLVATTGSRALLAAFTVLGLVLAAFTLYAARELKQLAPRARVLSKAAAIASLVNVPLGSVLGLIVLGQLTAPRVDAVLRERSATRRVLVRKV